MRTEDLYKNKNECCGCELCAQSCPKNIIRMQPDEEGFLYPVIGDNTTCINCKRCLNVCPEKSAGRKGVDIIRSFSFSLPDNQDLKRSASGGLATAISREFVKKGGVVYGVAYCNHYRSVNYVRASKEEDLEQLRGSKYVQAIKGLVYSQVSNDLKDGKDVLFIGLPCEVSALYHSIVNTEHLYTVSLICHGPTSQKVHRDYIDSLPNAKKALSFLSVRYKFKGWKPYYIHAEYVDGTEYNEEWSPSDYGMAFLYLKRPSCITCRYKAYNREFGLQSDLTIGDFHGVGIQSPQYNKWGVSQASIQTEKGHYLANLVVGDGIAEIPYSIIKVTNRGLFIPIPQRGDRQRFMHDYIGKSLHDACHSSMVMNTNRILALKNVWARIERLLKNPAKIFNKIVSVLKKK